MPFKHGHFPLKKRPKYHMAYKASASTAFTTKTAGNTVCAFE